MSAFDEILLIGDSAAWSIDDDAFRLQNTLCKQFKTSIDTTPRAHALNHFVNRYAFLRSQERGVLTWYHGAVEDPSFAPLYAKLRQAGDRVLKIVTSCSTTRVELIKAGFHPTQISVIPLGVRMQAARSILGNDDRAWKKKAIRSRDDVPADAFVVGSFVKDGIGSIGDKPKMEKGPDLLLEVAKILKGKIHNLFFLLYGQARQFVCDGLRNLQIPFLHKQAKELDEVYSAYQNLDCYLIHSRCEGGPKGMLEAWAMQCPLVATRCGMVADWAIDGFDSLLSSVGDAEELASHLLSLRDCPEQAHFLATNAAEKAALFDWPQIANMHWNLIYNPLINPPPVDDL